MMELVVLIAMVSTALVSLGLSYIPALWGVVFSFASGIVALLTGGAVIYSSIMVDEYVMWSLIVFAIVAVGWTNIVRVKAINPINET
jgi:hypothetical protein